MTYYGSWKLTDNLIFAANTHRVDTGAAQDADAVPAYRISEDTTTVPILTGSMALHDAANTIGFYTTSIAITAANGFEKGRCYTIYIEAAVNGIMGTMHHNFQIEAEVDANAVSPNVIVGGLVADAITATSIQNGALTAAKFAAGAFDAVWTVASRTLTAFSTALALSVWDVLESAIVVASSLGLKLKTNVDAAISSRSTYAGGDTTGTTTLLSRIIGTLAAGTHQPQSGDSFTRLGAPVGASHSADVAAVKSDTTAINTAVDTEVAAIKAKTDQLVFTTANRVDSTVVDKTGFALTTGERDAIATALLDLSNGVETGQTVRRSLRAMAAILAGDVTGAGSATELFKALGNAGTTRVTVPVDPSGNRTGVTVS